MTRHIHETIKKQQEIMNKNFESFGVQEMNAKEMENTNGGIFGLLIAVLVFSLGYGVAQLLFGEN